jgi:hypothetical protein
MVQVIPDNPAIQGRRFTEDVTIGGAVTYLTGGIVVTLKKAALIQRAIAAQARGVLAVGTTQLSVAILPGSESGSTVKLQAFTSNGAAPAALVEVPNASALLQNVVVTFDYEGT